MNILGRKQEEAGGSETIFIVEDNGPLRALVAEYLTEMGYTIIEAKDGEEALRVIDGMDNPVHVLVTDITMPKFDGRTVAEKMLTRQPGVKVIYMTGYSDDTHLRAGALGGHERFLQKPFALDALNTNIRDLLRRPSLRDCQANPTN